MADPGESDWVYDTIPQYRLNPGIIQLFLDEIWPGGYEFFIEVCRSRPRTR